MATQLAEAPEAAEPAEVANDIKVQTAPVERDYEAEAKAQGWTPKEDFRGDETRWVDAETFMKRADEVMPLLKKQNAHLKSEIDQLKRSMRKVVASERNAHANALAELEARQEAAVETGDVAEHRRIGTEIKRLGEVMADDTPGQSHGEDPAEQFDTFREANPWFDKANLASASETEINARLHADRLAEKYVRQGLDKEIPPSEFFERVARETAEKFPALNAKAPRPKPASDVAGVTPPGARGAKTGANLPPEAKETVRRYMRQGHFKGTFEESCNLFAKDYF